MTCREDLPPAEYKVQQSSAQLAVHRNAGSHLYSISAILIFVINYFKSNLPGGLEREA